MNELKEKILSFEDRREYLANDLNEEYLKSRKNEYFIVCDKLWRRYNIKYNIKWNEKIVGIAHLQNQYIPHIWAIEFNGVPQMARYCLEEITKEKFLDELSKKRI